MFTSRKNNNGATLIELRRIAMFNFKKIVVNENPHGLSPLPVKQSFNLP